MRGRESVCVENQRERERESRSGECFARSANNGNFCGPLPHPITVLNPVTPFFLSSSFSSSSTLLQDRKERRIGMHYHPLGLEAALVLVMRGERDNWEKRLVGRSRKQPWEAMVVYNSWKYMWTPLFLHNRPDRVRKKKRGRRGLEEWTIIDYRTALKYPQTELEHDSEKATTITAYALPSHFLSLFPHVFSAKRFVLLSLCLCFLFFITIKKLEKERQKKNMRGWVWTHLNM